MKKTFTRPEEFYRLLLAMISHDVKTPLANALYMLKLNSRMGSGKESQEDMRQFLQTLEKYLAEAHSLFSELLGWSRTYFIPPSADSGTVCLMTLTEEIIKFTSDTQTVVNSTVINNVPPGLQLPGSHMEIYKFVLRNLILNCARLGQPAESNISIAAETKDNRYEISISTDARMPSELIRKVLSSNGHIPQKAAGTDWALSLLLCRHCLSELGTVLRIEPAEEAFYFTLPSI